MIANTPEPPYFAVIFTSIKNGPDDGYEAMSEAMVRLAKEQDGFLGVESSRTELGITVSYWTSLEAIRNWKADTRHQVAQKSGREKWYKNYKVRICKIERDYEFNS
jgi:heme-degrading monooxygenase HmoA